MLRLFDINCAKSFFRPAQHDTEVFVAHSGLLQDLFLRFFFQIEAAQYAPIAIGELLQAGCDGLARQIMQPAKETCTLARTRPKAATIGRENGKILTG